MTVLRLLVIAIVPFALVFAVAWEVVKWALARRAKEPLDDYDACTAPSELVE